VVVRLHVHSFIATLASSSVVAALITMVSGGTQPPPPTSTVWTKLTGIKIFGFSIMVVYLLAMAVVLWWFLEHTPPGRRLFAVGANYEAARLAGVKVEKCVWLSLVASAGISGIAGIMFASDDGPSLTFGSGLLLSAYAAAFLGTTQLKPDRFNVWGTLLGVYVLATGVEGLQFVSGAQWLDDMFNGVVLILAVSFAIWRQRVGPGRRGLGRRLRYGGTAVEPPGDPAVPAPAPVYDAAVESH
jgi:ribose transport system permease protein